MLATTSLTPLLVNLQSMKPKPNADGGSKDCVTWKVEEAMHNFVHADKVTTDSSADYGKIAAAAGGLSHTERGAASSQTSPRVFEHFLALDSTWSEWGRTIFIFIDADE